MRYEQALRFFRKTNFLLRFCYNFRRFRQMRLFGTCCDPEISDTLIATGMYVSHEHLIILSVTMMP